MSTKAGEDHCATAGLERVTSEGSGVNPQAARWRSHATGLRCEVVTLRFVSR